MTCRPRQLLIREGQLNGVPDGVGFHQEKTRPAGNCWQATPKSRVYLYAVLTTSAENFGIESPLQG